MDLVRQGDGCARNFIQRDPSIGRQCEQRVHHALSCLGAAVRHASHNQKLYAIACRAFTCAWPHGHTDRSMFPPEHRSHCLTLPHRMATCLSGMERRRSVSCSSATLGGSSSLRSTSTALGRSDGFLCISQRTSRAAYTAHAFSNAVFEHGSSCHLVAHQKGMLQVLANAPAGVHLPSWRAVRQWTADLPGAPLAPFLQQFSFTAASPGHDQSDKQSS